MKSQVPGTASQTEESGSGILPLYPCTSSGRMPLPLWRHLALGCWLLAPSP